MKPAHKMANVLFHLPPYGPHRGWGAPWWGSPWMGRRPSVEDEREALSDYIATLKDELQDAEACLKELEETK